MTSPSKLTNTIVRRDSHSPLHSTSTESPTSHSNSNSNDESPPRPLRIRLINRSRPTPESRQPHPHPQRHTPPQPIPATAVPKPQSIHPNLPIWTPPTRSQPSGALANTDTDNAGLLALERLILAHEAQQTRMRAMQAMQATLHGMRVQRAQRNEARGRAVAARHQTVNSGLGRETSARPSTLPRMVTRERRRPVGVWLGPHAGCVIRGVHRCGGL
ncbi:hypothetical protein J1614_007009 [Plenodomus biglobosus]|nr:hypothetical protein J1614_007009 [Plenodomus biglobosus]